MAKKTINKKKTNKVAKRASQPQSVKSQYVQNVEALEIDMLRSENAKLRQCLTIYQSWYEVPQAKLLHLIKMAQSV